MKTEQTFDEIPEPKNKRGYTVKEIKAIFGNKSEAILKEIDGCTVMKNDKGEILIYKVDVFRARDIVSKGYSEIPWD